ncbi:RNA polymerase sigma factor [Paenibacillus sp. CGMCC 1.16610]|uniref:Sigma-70 family RNA polymerase sigma factor n=1 Tax=Paenibacillus anseongense TaxID=2682845 RepID=A0ABW9U8M8_9BACL|nr:MULTISPECIES: RNA polymerase sigma factor [Paenibacillus]MBA2937290.1 RNA polymerase sigma factor [Paenibacillus sp. CGMCC 1.16610]MVQ36348.1 sigma-70 family RNA polymerase sigma factor [Paenibacillus anseongense]
METTGVHVLKHMNYLSETTDQKAVLHNLMETYGNDVWNYAFTICRNTDLSDDITQDCFLKVYRNLTTFRGDASVKTWLLTITRNTAYDYLRKAFWRKVTHVGFIQSTGTSDSAENEVMEKLNARDMWKNVISLPPKYREILILHAHNQLSIKEIAAVLNISEGTVKSRLHRARLKVIELKERAARELC